MSDPDPNDDERLAALRAQIAAHGPMPVSAFMKMALYDPAGGYYMRRRPFGSEGDFTTAPEISQLFGEMLGIWCVLAWQAMGQPAPVRIVEWGPGRGTMMADIWRTLKIAPQLRDAANVELWEVSPNLRDLQRKTLRERVGTVPRIRWPEAPFENDAMAQDMPTILVANELLDAIPVDQMIFRQGHWHDRLVEQDEDRPGFKFSVGASAAPAPDTMAKLATGRTPPADGAIFEHRSRLTDDLPALWQLAKQSAPCAALFIDYGHEGPALGDTLQAVQNHTSVDPLDAPGAADISAHVDFAAFATDMEHAGFTAWPRLTQAQFLGALGIEARLSSLLAGQPADVVNRLEAGAARIMSPSGMGRQFRTALVTSPQLPPIPPFAG